MYGRVLDVPYAEVDKLAKMIPMEIHITIKKSLEQNRELKELYETNEQTRKLIDIAMGLEGLPRNASTHACGVVITKNPVDTYVPLYVNEGNISTQYTMTLLEELGLLKMDFLGLRTLTVIEEAKKLVKQCRGIDVEFDKDMNDPKVYKLWQDGKTSGIFQFESAGMTNFMKELKPDCLEDIIAGVSLYRPGPMDQIPRYIKNKLHPDNVEYTHPALEPILNVTYGCMVYQEQVMQIVRELAGYSLGRADLVRRAMGKKKLDVMAKEREYFIYGQTDDEGNVIIPGCIRNGIDEKSANKIFDEMAEFAKYAFNKSHAAAYAVVSYRTAYLKAYYKEELMAATQNSFLGNLDKIPEYIYECKKLGIEILKPDINKSSTKFTVDNSKIRFGLGSVKNVGIAAINAIVEERKKHGDYKDFSDFCERIQGETVNKKCIESLIKAGVFDCFETTRSTLIASYEGILDTINVANKKSLQGQVSMFDMGADNNNLEEIKYNYINLKEYSDKELLSMEKEMLGLYISGHPLDPLKQEIDRQTNINTLKMLQIKEQIDNMEQNMEFKDGQNVKYAGIISKIKRKYTKKNTTMAFVTIEDLYGECEVIVFDSCYNRYSNYLMEDAIVIVEGRLSIREDEDIKIVASSIRPLKKQTVKQLLINITNLNEETRNRLKGAIKFFSGEKANIQIMVEENGIRKEAGGMYLTEDILKNIQEIVTEQNAKVVEI